MPPAISIPLPVTPPPRPHQDAVHVCGFLAMLPPTTARATEATTRAVSARGASLEVVHGGGGPFVKSSEQPVFAAPNIASARATTARISASPARVDSAPDAARLSSTHPVPHSYSRLDPLRGLAPPPHCCSSASGTRRTSELSR